MSMYMHRVYKVANWDDMARQAAEIPGEFTVNLFFRDGPQRDAFLAGRGSTRSKVIQEGEMVMIKMDKAAIGRRS